MGSKVSNLFAVVIMNYIVDKALEITPLSNKAFVIIALSVFIDKKLANEFEKVLNSLHLDITFTTKRQSKNC